FGDNSIDLRVQVLFEPRLFVHGFESISLPSQQLTREDNAFIRIRRRERRNQIFSATRDQPPQVVQRCGYFKEDLWLLSERSSKQQPVDDRVFIATQEPPANVTIVRGHPFPPGFGPGR